MRKSQAERIARKYADLGKMRPGAKVKSLDSPLAIVGRVASFAVGAVLVALIVALLIIPRVLGGQALTVLSGSMRPTFSAGDIVVVRAVSPGDVCSKVAINDIVTYLPQQNSPDLITHRVVSKTVGSYPDGTNCRLTVQGDANNVADGAVSPLQVRGLFMYSIPWLGWARDWAVRNPVLMIGALAVMILASYAWQGWRGPRTRVLSIAQPNAPSAVGLPDEVADVLPIDGAAVLPNNGASMLPDDGASVLPDNGVASLAANNERVAAFADGNDQVVFNNPDWREREFALRERELDLRERELALREAETRTKLGWPRAAGYGPTGQTTYLAEVPTRSSVLTRAALSEPVLNEPVLHEPVLTEPVLTEPVLNESVLNESAAWAAVRPALA